MTLFGIPTPSVDAPQPPPPSPPPLPPPPSHTPPSQKLCSGHGRGCVRDAHAGPVISSHPRQHQRLLLPFGHLLLVLQQPGSSDYFGDHDRREQPALGGTCALALALHGALRPRFPHDGPVSLPQDAALALPQAARLSRPAGKSSGRPKPPAGPQEEEGTPKHVAMATNRSSPPLLLCEVWSGRLTAGLAAYVADRALAGR